MKTGVVVVWIEEQPEPVQQPVPTRLLKISEHVELRLSERNGKRFKHMLGSICIASDESTAECERHWPIEAVALLRQWADELEAHNADI